jgi:hypothetical protein
LDKMMHGRKPLVSAEVDKLMASVKGTRNAARDRCLMLLMFRHGLCVSEARGLQLSQVDIESRMLHIARLKQGLSTTHPLRPDEIRAIKAWLAECAKMEPNTEAFFTTKWTLWTWRNCLMAARRLPTTRPVMMKTAGGLSVRWTTANSIWWSGQNEMGGRGLLPRIVPMTGKSEHIVHYTAEQLKAKRQRGEGQTDWHMSQEEAIQRRHADPEAPFASS